MNIHFAAAWLRSFVSSPEDALSFYAEEFEYSDPPHERFIRKDKAALARAFRALSNKDPSNGLGIHLLEAVEYLGDQNSGLVLWKWSAKHTAAFFGLPTNGTPVQTTGISYHVYRNGKITREIVYSDQIHVAQQLGYPVQLAQDSFPTLRQPSDLSKRIRH
ncbi:MAG: ester cyclase [Panacagrimonas sp.]